MMSTATGMAGELLCLILLTASCGSDDDNSDPGGESGSPDPVAVRSDDRPEGLLPDLGCASDERTSQPIEDPKATDSPIGLTVRGHVTNEEGQVFEVAISGPDSLVREDIDKSLFCFAATRIEDVDAEWSNADYDSAVTALLEGAAEQTGMSVEELSAYRDEHLDDEPTMRGIALHFGATRPQVLAAAREALGSGFTASRAELLDDLMAEPMAPFLGPALKGVPPGKGDAELLADEESVVVEVALVNFGGDMDDSDDRAQPAAVDFAFDPPIHATQAVSHRYYRAKCARTAAIRLSAQSGRMTAYMVQRDPYKRIGSRYANASVSGAALSDYLSAPTGKYRSLDVSVQGMKDRSHYTLYGGWSEGSGGGC